VLMIGSFALAIFLGAISKVIPKWYPVYTFYWGDRIKKYDNKVSLMKFVGGGIVLAIIVGLVVNYIYDKVL
jgi:H+/Cl- antiporter ClcA